MAKTAATKKEESPEAIRKKLVLTGADIVAIGEEAELLVGCLLYTSPSPRDRTRSRMPSSA